MDNKQMAEKLSTHPLMVQFFDFLFSLKSEDDQDRLSDFFLSSVLPNLKREVKKAVESDYEQLLPKLKNNIIDLDKKVDNFLSDKQSLTA